MVIKEKGEDAIAEVDKLKTDIEVMATFISKWCERITENGSSWDEWDNLYKDASYRKDKLIYQLVEKYKRQEAKDELKAEIDDGAAG